jgi:hypothetical protein
MYVPHFVIAMGVDSTSASMKKTREAVEVNIMGKQK